MANPRVPLTEPYEPLIQSIIPCNLLPATLKIRGAWHRIHEFTVPETDADTEVHVLMDDWCDGRWVSTPRMYDFRDDLVKELMVILIEMSLRKPDRLRLCLSFVKYFTQPIIPASDDNVDSASNMLHFSLVSSVGNVIRLENDAYDQAQTEWAQGIVRDATEPPPAYEADVERVNHHEQVE